MYRDEDDYYNDDINDAIELAELNDVEPDDDYYDEDEAAANAASAWENSRGQ